MTAARSHSGSAPVSADGPRRHGRLLALIALGAAAPMVYFAVRQGIEYDGWWHIFIAREVPWARFWRDVVDNAHPPTFYLLLRAVTLLGSERLVYRSVSIVVAVAATVVIGRIARRVYRAAAVSLLCAFAFGFALTTVVMASAVRSYMLSAALVVMAFRHYLDLIDPDLPRVEAKTRVWFAGALIAAIATHYAALFVFAAAVVLPCCYAIVDGGYRTWWRERLRTRWRADLATIGAVAAVAVAVYVLHVSKFADPIVHTAQYNPDRSEAAGGLAGALSFLARSIVPQIDLFAPYPLARFPAAARAVVVATMAALTAGLALMLRRRPDWVVASAPLATLVILTVAIMAASVAKRYPFGGFLRHQFILFPFIMLSGFALVDEIVARARHKRVLLAGVCVGIVLNGLYQWRSRYFSSDPGADAVAEFIDLFGDSHAVYVDQFSLIPLFAGHLHDKWSVQWQLGESFFAIPVVEPQRTLVVLRDMTRWSCDLSERALYADLRRAMEVGGFPAIDLMRLRQDAHIAPPPPQPERARLAEAIVYGAASAGLRVERLVLDGPHLYARLRPAGTAGGPPALVRDIAPAALGNR
jgi:hypothetical protein